jgi:hypothetical protein
VPFLGKKGKAMGKIYILPITKQEVVERLTEGSFNKRFRINLINMHSLASLAII